MCKRGKASVSDWIGKCVCKMYVKIFTQCLGLSFLFYCLFILQPRWLGEGKVMNMFEVVDAHIKSMTHAGFPSLLWTLEE